MNRYKKTISHLDATTWLIIINVALFTVLAVTTFVSSIFGNGNAGAEILATLALPCGSGIIAKPWTLITYMFVHTDVWHLVFNMLWLYWFGRMYCMLMSGRAVTWVYMIGGIAGATAYIIAGLISPAIGSGRLEGASASVMAIVAATACTAPNMKLNLIFLGALKLKWIALATFVIFALGLTGSNAGAHVAHIGGLTAGVIWVFAHKLRRQYRSKNLRSTPLDEAQARAMLDTLLDKVKRSGYSSLSHHERQMLIQLSKRV